MLDIPRRLKGKEFKKLMIDYNVTAIQLSRITGITYQTVNSFLSERRQTDDSTYNSLAGAFEELVNSNIHGRY